MNRPRPYVRPVSRLGAVNNFFDTMILTESFLTGESTMPKKILVAYATKCGSTGEVAEAVGDELRKAGLEVEVRRAKEVKDISAYQAVVLGSPARMGKLISEGVNFAHRFRAQLGQVTTAYFLSSLLMTKDTPENRQTASDYLAPLAQVREPVSLGLFAGKVDHTKMEIPFRWIFARQQGSEMADADYRDWDRIRAWAREIAPLLARG